MRVLVTGGGTGGHVTPLLAIADEIRQLEADSVVVFVGFKGDRAMHEALIDDGVFNRIHVINAGKFRRYHGISLWRQIIDLPTVFKNIRDFLRTISGVFAAVRILRKERPDVVFAKGGFIGVPVGTAAKITNTPLVIHDSDTVAGLANRIVARWAQVIATGAPIENYSHYPEDKLVEVGVPVPTDVLQAEKLTVSSVREELGLPVGKPVSLVFGGTHGGKEINEAVIKELSSITDNTFLVQVAGASNYQAVEEALEGVTRPKNFRLLEFVEHTQMMKYFRAADIVIARVGATAMAEMAILSQAAILVPNPRLTGGHQIKNAKRFSKAKAAIVIQQDKLIESPGLLVEALEKLVNDSKLRRSLAGNLHKLAKPNATSDLAKLILKTAKGEK